MAIYTNNDVKFSGIRQPLLVTGGKLGVGKYAIDENGNIINSQPIINAIDIDWNNASIEGLNTITSTSDLINLLKNIKTSVPTNIYDLPGSNNLLTLQDIQALKPQLTGKSAYELAKETYEESTHQTFPYATVDAWIASLKGEQGQRGFSGTNGKDGKSAYEIAQEYYESIGREFPYNNENEWIQTIISGNDTKKYTDQQINDLNTQLIGYTDQQINNLNTQLNTLVQDSISDSVNKIIDGASNAFDTLKEIENWINNLPMSPQEIQLSLNSLQNDVSDITGELKEEKTIDDGNGNITHIIDYKTYDKTGEQYAKSLEEVNEKINNLLNTVSVAKDVQDGAQENLIEYVTHRDQTFNINGENVIDHFINIEKPENTKTILLSVNKDLLDDINNDIINKSVQQSKDYIDEKFSWDVIE